MDSGLLSVLFYIFIIVIFLSSLFRKKPQGTQGKQTPQQPRYPGRYGSQNTGSTTSTENNNEILEEIENLFNKTTPSPGIPEGNPETPPARKETKIESYSREAQKRYETGTLDEYSKWPGSGMGQKESTVAAGMGKVEKELNKIDSKIEEEARLFEQLLNKKEEESYFIKNLREKFKDPQTLREYIVINEILGKPKALRR